MSKSFIPFFRDNRFMRRQNLNNLHQFVLPKLSIPSEPGGVKPKLRLTACLGDMHMNRFAQVITVEAEPVASFPQHRRHAVNVSSTDLQATRKMSGSVTEVSRRSAGRGTQ